MSENSETKWTNFHLCIDLRGALRNWTPSEWRNCCTDGSGKTLTPDQVRDEFMEELSKGRKFIPAAPCDNFDYQEGCKGHPSSARGTR